MSFNALVYRAMIASPGDVPSERELIRTVIAEWTAVHAVDRAAVLLPVSWESHSAPEMGARPQSIINRRLLSDCDLLIAAFWTRIGSPTGEAISGSVEEIEEHIAAGKEAMIYFSQAPVRLDSVDQAQYEQLKTFRQSCQSRGLYETYESLSEFREKLSRQLAVTMIRLIANNRDASAVTTPETSVEERQEVPPMVSLSPAARDLLKTASQDPHGMFMRVNVFGGAIIQAHSRLMNVQGDARNLATWDAAIEELENLELIKASTYKRETFKVTSSGYAVADSLPSTV